MIDATCIPADVRTGLWLAHSLDLPVSIGGREVRVPDDIASACTPPAAAASGADVLSDLELGRRALFAIRLAGEAIGALGLDLGLIAPAPREPAGSSHAADWHTPLTAHEPVPFPAFVRRVRGETWISTRPDGDPVAIVRPNDTGAAPTVMQDRSWLVVHSWRNAIVAWHPTHEAALADALDQVRSGQIRGTGDGSILTGHPQDMEG